MTDKSHVRADAYCVKAHLIFRDTRTISITGH